MVRCGDNQKGLLPIAGIPEKTFVGNVIVIKDLCLLSL